MDLWIVVPLAILCGLAGAAAGNKLNLPAGILTGAIVGVGAALGLFGLPEIEPHPVFRQMLQVLAGTMVGLRINREALRAGSRSLLPASLIAFAFIVGGAASAFVAVRFTSMDAPTALFAAMPGGMTEMSSVAAGFGANGVSVAAIHLVRILVVMFLAGILVSRLQRGKRAPHAQTHALGGSRDYTGGGRRLAIAILAGGMGGIAGLMAGIPAGGVIGALAGCAITRLSFPGRVRSRRFQISVQAMAGTLIGFGISREFLGTLVHLAGATALIITAQLLVWALLSYLFLKFSSRDSITVLFSSAPGGLTELTAASGRLGADMVIVAFTHLMRLTTTVVLAPLLISLLISG